MRFVPQEDQIPRGRYQWIVPIAFDQVLSAAVPALGRLQDLGENVASPTGFGRMDSLLWVGCLGLLDRGRVSGWAEPAGNAAAA